ncbi:MAG: dTMP kinase [Sphingomicrobium sp.]
MERGKFITLEGGEGAGKSTQVQALAEALKAQGIDCLVTREPGGSPGAEAIRALVLEGDDERWTPRSEALLFAAARADHLARTILPALDAGRWVICDRFLDSSLSYQGGAGGLEIDEVRAINAFAIGDAMPDRTLVLALAEGGARARARDDMGSDRIGGRDKAYHQKVDLAFRQLVAEEPERLRLIDASGSPEEVTQRLLSTLADLLP